MNTVTSKMNMKDGVNTVVVEWWINNFWDGIDKNKIFYSQAFPTQSKPKFRLCAKLLGDKDCLMALSFCIWNEDFQYYNHRSLDVTVACAENSKMVITGEVLKLQDHNKILEYNNVRQNQWNNIKNYNFSDIETNRRINIMFISLSISYANNLYNIDNLSEAISMCNFNDLFDDETYKDIIIKTGDNESRKAHRTVLVAQGKKFHTLLKPRTTIHDIDDNLSILEIPEVTKETIDVFLKFMYSGILMAVEFDDCKILLELAYKYDIPNLKLIAQEEMYKLLSVNNAVDILVTAYKHNAEKLMNLTTLYMIESGIKTFIKTPGWQLLKMSPGVSTYMLESMYS